MRDGRLWWKDIGLLIDYVWRWMPGGVPPRTPRGRRAAKQESGAKPIPRLQLWRAGGTLTMEPQHFAGCGTSGRLHGGEGGSDVDAPWATATLYGGASRS